MAFIRTFVAIEASMEQRGHAGRLIERLKGAEANVNWVAAEYLHWTLKFIGNVDETEVHNVCRAVSTAAETIDSFELDCVGAGAFPDARRPRTVWAGAGQGSEPAMNLQAAIEDALEQLGYPPDGRQFHPHLTLGRVRGSGPATQRLGELVLQHDDFSVGKVIVDELVVFSSQLNKSGPRYTALAHTNLA